MINAILTFLPKPLLFWSCIGLALLVGVQTTRVDRLKTENAAYKVAVAQCVKTNRQNTKSVSFFKLQNEQCLVGRRADETTLANAVAAWSAEKILLIEKAEDIEIQNVEVYRTPDCVELAQMDIGAICPDFVNGMQRRAENYSRIRND